MTFIDYVCIALLLLFVIAGAVKGFAKIVLRLAGYVAAVLGARFAAAPLVEYIYNRFLHEMVQEKLTTLIPSGSVGASLDEILKAIRGTLSESAYNIASFLHLLPEERTVSQSFLTVNAIETTYVQPIITKVLLIITTITLFIVFMVMINIVINISDKKLFKRKKGVVSSANRLLGGVVGLAQGVIPVGALCMLLNVIAPVTQNPGFKEMVSNSLFCSTVSEIFR